jgi:hypothetical protein
LHLYAVARHDHERVYWSFGVRFPSHSWHVSPHQPSESTSSASNVRGFDSLYHGE